MATKGDDVPEGKITICGFCKEKFKTLCKGFADEWSNNFKMCFCPWKSKTYDVDADSVTTDQTQLLQHKEKEMANIVGDDHKEQVVKFINVALISRKYIASKPSWLNFCGYLSSATLVPCKLSIWIPFTVAL